MKTINLNKVNKKYVFHFRTTVTNENTGKIRLVLHEIFRPEEYEGRTIYTLYNKYYIANNVDEDIDKDLEEE